MTAEEWRPCGRNPAYEVSCQGRVRNTATGRILKPSQNHSRGGRRPGYFHVGLGPVRNQYVHHLVAYAFLGERPPGHDIDHINTDREDNRAVNLRYVPLLANRMRWVGPGRNDYDSRKHWERENPDPDHEPLTAEEQEALHGELTSAGW